MDNKILEELKSKRISPEVLESMSDDDKKYFYLNTGIMYISALNAVDRGIREHERMLRTIIPEPVEDLKILISRISDIKKEEIKDLSAGFLENLFTVNDRVLNISMPEIGNVDGSDFKKFVIEQIKNSDEEVSSANEIKNQIIQQLEEDIPADNISLLKDPIAMDEWMTDYLKRKAESDDTPEDQKEDFAKKLEAKEQSFTLEPLKKSIDSVIKAKSNTSSIMHGFYFENERVLKAAVKTCSNLNITFPFQLFTGIQDILFGDKYSKYKNLLLFLWARYLKYKGKETVTDWDKIFITNVHTHLVLLKRSDDWKNNEKFQKFKDSIEEILDKVIKYNPSTKK